MPDSPPRPELLDFNHIDDPQVRRILRTMHQQTIETLHRQQLEIDAILEILLEKHLTSVSEFKRRLLLLQQDASRGERIERAFASPQTPPPAPMH